MKSNILTLVFSWIYVSKCSFIANYPGVMFDFKNWYQVEKNFLTLPSLSEHERALQCESAITAKIYIMVYEGTTLPPFSEDIQKEEADILNVQKCKPEHLTSNNINYGYKFTMIGPEPHLVQMFPCVLLEDVEYYLTSGLNKQYLFQKTFSTPLSLVGLIEPTPIVDMNASKPTHIERLEKHFIESNKRRNKLCDESHETNESSSDYNFNMVLQFKLCTSVFDALNRTNEFEYRSTKKVNYMRINGAFHKCFEKKVKFRKFYFQNILTKVTPCAINTEWSQIQFYVTLDPTPGISGVFVLGLDKNVNRRGGDTLFVIAHLSYVSLHE